MCVSVIPPLLLGSNSAFLRVVRCRSLSEEYGLHTSNKDEISKMSSLSVGFVDCSLFANVGMKIKAYAGPKELKNRSIVHLVAAFLISAVT